MKILLSPSETKLKGGEESFILSSLLFQELYPQRLKLLHHYINLLQKGDIRILSKLFGLKKEKEIRYYQKDIIYELTYKAIQRYTGVAFKYLDYENLTLSQQNFIDSHVIIFSHLFGAIRASDKIPEYKLKQNEAIGEIKPEQFYKKNLTTLLDNYLEKEEILDLRAGFYDKFYKPTKNYTTLKFIKEGKVISHWAKAYRGIILREIAIANISTIEEFKRLTLKGLIFKEEKITKNKTEFIYEIEKND